MESQATAPLNPELLPPVDPHDIGLQVDRILHHPLFQQSKRLPIFLQFIVQESLLRGTDSPPKERTIGIEVFGRRPDYDTNMDPIVRVTATELRKKLAQYYYEDGHADEIRIELPSGSYLPKFRRTAIPVQPAAPTVAAISREVPHASISNHPVLQPLAINQTPARDEGLPQTRPEHSGQSTLSQSRWLWAIVAACTVAVAAAGAFVMHSRTNTSLGRFWKSFAGNANEVLIILPSIGSANLKETTASTSSLSVAAKLSMEDANIIARVAGQLEKQNARYRLVSSMDTNFEEMRSGPSVLVGAIDNSWTMRMSKDIPFVFAVTPDGHTGQIVETGTKKRTWTLDIYTPHLRITHDYGVIARYKSSVTGKPVIIIAGIASQGTQAAGELLTSTDLIELIPPSVTKAANFEVVIETEAIDGHAGPPHVIASQTW